MCVILCIVAISGCHREDSENARTSREFGYVANGITPGRVSEFTIDPDTGAWAQIPSSPFHEGGSEPYSIAPAPSRKFLYAVDRGDSDLSAFSIDSATGSLAAVGARLHCAPLNAKNLVLHPAGNFLFVTNVAEPGTVSAFSVDRKNGTLSPVPGSPFAAGGYPDSLAVTSSGRFLYATNHGPPGSVSAYAIDSGTGALAPIAGSPFAAGIGAEGIAMSPAGRFLYVSDSYGGTVLAFAIDQAGGALTTIAGSPFPAGSHPSAMAIDPAGKFLYAINETTLGTISVFVIDQTSGAVAPVAGSPFSTGPTPTAMAIDPSGKFLSATLKGESEMPSANMNGTIASFRIDAATGALKPIDGSPFDAGPYPTGVAIVQSK